MLWNHLIDLDGVGHLTCRIRSGWFSCPTRSLTEFSVDLRSCPVICESQMAPLELRPTFQTVTGVEPNDVLRLLEAALTEGDENVVGRIYTSSAVLKVRPEHEQFWSPQLQISVDPHLPGGSVVRGRFGPRPAIWSMFVAIYAAIGFLTMMGVIYGYSQLTLGGSGVYLWSGPIGIALALVVYLVARTGRSLGMSQMRQLKKFFEDAAQG